VLHVVTGIPILANIRFLGVAENLMEDLVKEDWGFRTPDSPKIQEVFEKIQEKLDKVLTCKV